MAKPINNPSSPRQDVWTAKTHKLSDPASCDLAGLLAELEDYCDDGTKQTDIRHKI